MYSTEQEITFPTAYANSLIGILTIFTIDADLPPPPGAQSHVCWLGWVQQKAESQDISFLSISQYFISTANIAGIEDSSASVSAALHGVEKRFTLTDTQFHTLEASSCH